MRRIDTSHVTGSVGQPIKSGSVEHIFGTFADILKHLLHGIFNTTILDTVPYMLYGGINTDSPPHYAVQPGYLYFNGNTYKMNLSDITLVTDDAIIVVTTTYLTAANADPVKFTDGNEYNVHLIEEVSVIEGTEDTAGFLAMYDDVVFLNP